MKIFIKQAVPGSIVRFPGDPGRTLAADGEVVERSTYWARRIADGSVVISKQSKTTKEAAK